MSQLILASTSPYRKISLKRLGLTFDIASPKVDEISLDGEQALELATRLAYLKAHEVAGQLKTTNNIIIGADQAASVDNVLLRKPEDHNKAVNQLMACQGKVVSFYTACCVIDSRSDKIHQGVDHTKVQFLTLKKEQLERYIEIEKPMNCAGAFKAEGLGITLFQSIKSSDPTALLGLPLIWLTNTLRKIGLDPLQPID
ncbi:MAG: septum formation protein Maf [Rhodospirillaceae bacterium]|nr:septum formation protein Maf [Rhodospirillaceae bacterium]